MIKLSIRSPKTIIFDIETLGLNAYDPILCVSWKDLNSKDIMFRAAWNYPETWNALRTAKSAKAIEKAFQDIDKLMLKDVYDALVVADCLVGHFQDYFDIPFLKTRFLKHGIGCLPKSIQADTWKIARGHLKMRSNRLGALNEFFGLPPKFKQNDLSLWTAVKAGNKSAYALMERYNKQDVIATESLLRKLMGYAKLPLQPQLEGRRCQCGSHKVEKHGIRVTRTGRYQRYRCNSCGAYSKSLIRAAELRPE
jgi:uncharacterized protein